MAVPLLVLGWAARPASAARDELTVTSVDGYLAVVLPPGYDTTQLATSASERHRITSAALAAIAASSQARSESSTPETPSAYADHVVLLVDAEGNVVRPDLEAGATAGTLAEGDLTFTFESPARPFTAEQISSMQTWIRDLYPVVKAVYGPPAHGMTVNVRQDPTGDAWYSPASNEIVLPAPSPDVLIHEIIHAFHDEFMLVSQWEETMTRAVEVEALDRLGYPNPNAHHSYYYDVWADEMDAQPSVGSRDMNMWDGFPARLVRYNLGGYEWWKVLHARPAFFVNFNRTLYTRPNEVTREASLVEMAASAAPTVEGQPFTLWYISHGVFNSAPPVGPQFVMSPGTGVGWLISRNEGGGVGPLSGVPVAWQSQAADGRVLATGTMTTTPAGAAVLNKDPVPGSYAGRVMVTFTATVGTQPVGSAMWLSSASVEGVFGVAPGVFTGSVTIASLENPPSPAVTVSLARGAFDAPSLASAVGRFRATLTRSDGSIAAERVFTKDSSPYALILEARPAASVNLTTAAVTGPAVVTQGTQSSAAVTVRNVGASTAPPSSSRLLLSKDATPDGGDIRLPELARFDAIAPGAQPPASGTPLSVPATTPVGTYRLLSCADDNLLIPETAEADNCKAGSTVTVIAPTPDLAVLSVRPPPTQARRGVTFTAGDRTANTGQLAASASLNRYLLSRDKQRGAGDVLLTPRRQVPILPPGTDSSGTVNVTIPKSTPTGLYWVLACADDTNVVAESNESQNCKASGAQIKVIA